MTQIAQLNPPPEMIDFGIGQPSPDLLPLELMQQAAGHRLSQGDPSLLAYGAEQGDGYLRLALAQFLSDGYQIPVAPDHLFVTTGASQGLDLICTLFTQAGDTVFVEEPTYFLALRIFADHRLNVISIPMDEEGLVIEALEAQLEQHRPKFLYTVPTFHNPSSLTLSAARRKQLVTLGELHDFLIVADEVYQLLNYTVTPPPPLISYDQSGVVFSLGSFSKILAPGLRLGWIQAHFNLLEPLLTCGMLDSGGGLNPFTSGVVRSALEMQRQQEHLQRLKTIYRRRATALSLALKQYLPEPVTFVEPQGGFFVWLQLPEQIDAEALLPELRKNNVAFQSGIKFSGRQELRNFARLCFAYYNTADLSAGVVRLAEVVRRLY